VQQAVHEGRRAKRMIVRKEIYRAAIAHYNGNLTAAARYLGKDRATLHSAIKRGLLA
jgi:transcriptional regulator with GAF, ATPase, and Fis domain